MKVLVVWREENQDGWVMSEVVFLGRVIGPGTWEDVCVWVDGAAISSGA